MALPSELHQMQDRQGEPAQVGGNCSRPWPGRYYVRVVWERGGDGGSHALVCMENEGLGRHFGSWEQVDDPK